jgi:hypothetical protein
LPFQSGPSFFFFLFLIIIFFSNLKNNFLFCQIRWE